MARSDDDALGIEQTRIDFAEQKPLRKPPVPLRAFRPAHPSAAPLACCGSVPLEGDGNKARSFGGVETQAIGNAWKNSTEPNSTRFARTETKGRSEPGSGPARSLRGSHGEAKPFEKTTISAPRGAPVRVRNRDDGGAREVHATTAQHPMRPRETDSSDCCRIILFLNHHLRSSCGLSQARSRPIPFSWQGNTRKENI